MQPPAARALRSRPAAFLVAVIVLLCLLPTGAAKEGSFEWAEIRISPEVFEAELFGETREGDAASGLREIIDEDHGDSDGAVTEDEVAAYRTATMKRFNDQLSNPFARALVAEFQVEGRSPMRVRVTDVRLSDNVLGPVTENSTLLRDIAAEMTYPSSTRDRVNVTIGEDFRRAFIGLEWGYAIFTGNDHWAIDPDSIDPARVKDEYWTGDGFNVTYAETEGFASGFEPLDFQVYNTSAVDEAPKSKKKDSPGLTPVVLLVGILLVGLALRRRA